MSFLKPTPRVDDARMVGAVSERLSTYRRRLLRDWHTDITDPSQLARLRARLLVVAATMGMVATAASVLLNKNLYLALPRAVPVGIIVGLVVVAVHAAARGRRMADAEFAGVIASSQVFATVAVAAGQGAGHVASTALCLVASNVMAALFVERRLLAAAQPLIGTLCLIAVARSPAAGPGPLVDVSSGTFALITIVAVIRPLRDVAINSLRIARRGELTDPLTGLGNRRGLERAAGQYWRDRATQNLPVAVLVVDIDLFKQVNDTRGHAAGDEILRRLAELVKTTMRAEDVAVRMGGEEFLVLCHVTAGQAVPVAERLRLAVERELAPVTVSIGVYEGAPTLEDQLPTSLWEAVDHADRALYAAKRAGRNRVVSSGALRGSG